MNNQYQFYENKYVLDRKLYKYFSNFYYAKSCILNKQIHLDDPNDFNDPFDDAAYNGGIGCDGREGAINDGLLKRGRVSCFSEINNSILMWSYYANKHRGVCLEFDINKLDKNIQLNRNIINNISRVHYSPIRPSGDVLDFSDCNFMYTKADVWAHECEWRITCETQEEFLPFDCVTSIIFGGKFQPFTNDYFQLIELAYQENIDVFRCEFSIDQYRIELRDFTEELEHQLQNKAYLQELIND